MAVFICWGISITTTKTWLLKGLVHGYAHVRAMMQLIAYEPITNGSRSSAVCECFAVNQLASCARRYL